MSRFQSMVGGVFLVVVASCTDSEPECGNGTREGTEQCDDGNTQGGDTCSPACRVTVVDLCGNGTKDTGEECDDGNRLPNDTCSPACRLTEPPIPPRCGDTRVDTGEECDDGNTDDTDACRNTCVAARCGDSVVWTGQETCDDGTPAGGDGCLACALEPGWTCTGTTCVTTCGDGLVAGAETCDHGPMGPTVCCPATCRAATGCETENNDVEPNALPAPVGGVTSIRGDVLNLDEDRFSLEVPWEEVWEISVELETPGVSCVDENTRLRLELMQGDEPRQGLEGCAPLPMVLPAGTYVWRVRFSTPTQDMRVSYTLRMNVRSMPVQCGNNILELGEVCDDGNGESGDGCSSSCYRETLSELEPNNTPSAASPLDIRYIQTGTVQGDDVDLWAFTFAPKSIVEIETYGPDGPFACSNQDTRLRLLDAAGNPVDRWADDNGGIRQCSLMTNTMSVGGPHLVEVSRGPDSQAEGYQLVVRVLTYCGDGIRNGDEFCDGTPFCAADCESICGDRSLTGAEACDDGNRLDHDGCSASCALEPFDGTLEVEPNSSFAPQVVTGFPTTVQGVFAPEDEDCFTFTLPTTTDLRVALLGSCDGHRYDLQIVNLSGVAVIATNGGFGSCPVVETDYRFDARQVPAGAYVVCAKPTFFTTETLPWTLSISATAVCGNGVREGFELCDGTPRCGADCHPQGGCGDGFVDGDEVCDPGIAGSNCSASCTPPTAIVEVEPNDNFDQAQRRSIATPAVIISGASGVILGSFPGVEQDLYLLTNPSSGPQWWRLQTTAPDGRCPADLYLSGSVYIDGLNQAQFDTYDGKCPNKVVQVPALAGGFVQVQTNRKISTPPQYALFWDAPSRHGELAEPNDGLVVNLTGAQAGNALLEGQSDFAGDVDTFLLQMDALFSLRLESVSDTPTDCDSVVGVQVRLTGPGGATLAPFLSVCGVQDGSGVWPQNPDLANLAAGTWLVEVTGFSPGPYRLGLQAR